MSSSSSVSSLVRNSVILFVLVRFITKTGTTVQYLLWVSGTTRMQLTERLQVVHFYRKTVTNGVVRSDGVNTGQVKSGVDQHGSMTHTQNETIAVWPDRIGRIEAQELRPDRVCNWRHGHGCARMTGICLLDAIHSKATDGIDDSLLEFGEIIIDGVRAFFVVSGTGRVRHHFLLAFFDGRGHFVFLVLVFQPKRILCDYDTSKMKMAKARELLQHLHRAPYSKTLQEYIRNILRDIKRGGCLSYNTYSNS